MVAPSKSLFTLADKLYFRIGEVSRIVGVPTSVLRFWESQFQRIKPKRTETGQRLYRQSDLDLILEIKRLLYDQQFTIQGARNHLKNKANDYTGTACGRELIQLIRAELQHIRDLLE